MPLDVTGGYSYPNPRPDWLARHQEPILDPALPIVDAHHHLWEEPGKAYFGDDLVADLATGHNIIATIFVQAHFGYDLRRPTHLQPIGETEKVEVMRQDLQSRFPRYNACSGIVSFADLLEPQLLAEVLEAHTAASPRFRGIRHSVARDSHFPEGIVIRPAPAGMLRDARFETSIEVLGRRQLSFDAMLYHEQIDDLTHLARTVADTQIIVNHIGCPIGVGPYRGKESETLGVWRKSLFGLAKCANVSMKFGGLGMIILGAEHHLGGLPPNSEQLAAAWQPYFETCVEAFGSQRLLFESNFPVDKGMFSYPVVWNAFKRLTAAASTSEKEDLFSRTAARLYRLTLPSAT